MKFAIITRNTVFFFSMIAYFTSCKWQSNQNLIQNHVTDVDSSANAKLKIIKAENAKNNNIHCAIQDRNGNLWFGTTGQGAYKFDGKTFTHFTTAEGLYDNSVNTILEDKTGTIWFGTNSGLSRFDGKKFTNIPLGISNGNYLKTYKSTSEQSKNLPSKNAVWSMLQDKKGEIWFGTYNDGVYCYDGKKFTHFLQNDSVINNSKIRLAAVNSIVEDNDGNMWFATWFEGLCRYDGKELTSYKPNNEVWFSSILKDKDGKLWIGRRTNGAMIYDGKSFTNIVQGSTFDSCSVGGLLQDKAGNIWFGSIHSNLSLRDKFGGLWKYDGVSFKNITAKDGLDNNNIWSAVEDRNGNLWFGAVNTELYKYDGKVFTNFAE